MTSPTCATCRHWRNTYATEVGPVGSCTVNPPTIIPNLSLAGYGTWPRTHADEGCGQHEPSPRRREIPDAAHVTTDRLVIAERERRAANADFNQGLLDLVTTLVELDPAAYDRLGQKTRDYLTDLGFAPPERELTREELLARRERGRPAEVWVDPATPVPSRTPTPGPEVRPRANYSTADPSQNYCTLNPLCCEVPGHSGVCRDAASKELP